MRPSLGKILLTAFAGLLLVTGCSRSPAGPSIFGKGPRRIILISLDTLRADHVGCYGYGRNTSPTLDGIAREGVRFSHAVAPSNWTLPSHVSLFTGLYPVRHGVLEDSQALADDVPDLVESLRAAGFRTASFNGGGYLDKRYGMDRGFDVYSSDGSSDAWTETLNAGRRWLADHAHDDVFLFLHTYTIHAPYDAPSRFLKRFDVERSAGPGGLIPDRLPAGPDGIPDPETCGIARAYYDAGIAYADDQLRGFLSLLDDMGLSDNLLLIVSSDHGEQLWEHGDHGHNGDLLGDEVTEVPLIVRLPLSHGAKPAAGRTVDGQVGFLDILPTVLDAVGAKRPADLDGFSLMPELAGWPQEPIDADARRRRTAELPGGAKPVGLCEGEHFVAIESGHWKLLTRLPGAEKVEHEDWPALYDLKQDAAEQNPLPASGPAEKALTAAVDTLIGKWAGKRSGAKAAPLDEATRRQLEALGYL